MMRRRALPKNVEVLGGGQPMMVKGGSTIKALSSEFLYDLQKHWRVHRTQILDDVAAKYPQQYLAAMVTLSKVMRWEVGESGAFERPRSPEEVMDRLEQRIGPEGRKLFEGFLREVQQLEERQQLSVSPSGATPPAAWGGAAQRRNARSRGQG
jgi:hypothetical protein